MKSFAMAPGVPVEAMLEAMGQRKPAAAEPKRRGSKAEPVAAAAEAEAEAEPES